MKPLATYRRFNTLPQMAAAVCVFAAAALVLESAGLYDWAQRLELGPERTVALPILTQLHRALAPLGIEKQRQRGLIELARFGWSDDPAALAAAHASDATKPAPHQIPTPTPSPTTLITPAPAAKITPAPKPAAIRGEAPPLFTKVPAIDGVSPNETRTIALAGDSMMAVGLSAAILRDAPRYKDLAFLNLFKSGTGLARPEVFNWQHEYPAMLKDAQPDFVIVAIGANDGQGFVEDGVIYPFGSPGWQSIYQQRVEAYLDMLEADGATVIWLGLPPMKSDVYDERIAAINRIDYNVVTASPHAIWFSTAGLIGDTTGHFRDFGDVAGHTVRLRQGDGIHLSDEGAALIAAKLLPWLAAKKPDTATTAEIAKP